MNKQEMASKYCKPDFVVLDVGCGDRWIREYCKAEFYVGLDLNSERADVLADAEHLPFRDGCFDVVIAYSIIEHVKNPYLAFKEWLRVTRRLILLWTDYPLTPFAETDPTHLYCWSPKILRQFLGLFKVKTYDWVIEPIGGSIACVVEKL